jgi:cytochrome c oxidase subunit 3
MRLIITILLGIYFTIIQFKEYQGSSFTIADSIYGSTFFVATGFHGLHVLIGTIFLIVTFYSLQQLHFSSNHHFGFEAAA